MIEQRGRWSPRGRHIRLVLLTWPAVGLLGATFAAAACLLSDCDRGQATLAKETLVGHSGTVKSLSFRPDGGMLASVGIDGSIALWDLGTMPEARFLEGVSGPVRCAVFSPDNTVLATGNTMARLTLHNLGVAERRGIDDALAATVGAPSIAFAPDGATMAVGHENGEITLWDPVSGRKRATLEGHRDFVGSLTFSRDGTMLASWAGDRSVRIWDVQARCQRRVLKGQPTATAGLKFSPDGRFLVLGDQISPIVRLWDIDSAAIHASLRGPSGVVVATAISPDGETLAAADFKDRSLSGTFRL